MIRNYFRVALRNLLKHKAYSAINITGLAVGMACSLLILMYVRDELGFDRFHTNADRTYRFAREFTQGAPMYFTWSPLPLVPALKTEFPGIQTMRLAGNGPWSLVQSAQNQFQEVKIFWADSNFFDFFSFPLLRGNPTTALARPNSLVLTEDMARKYFGGADPVGKEITIDNTYHVAVTGVMATIPHNTHFRPDFLASFSTRTPEFSPDQYGNWSSNFLVTYFMLPTDMTLERFQGLLPAFLQKYATGGHKNTVLHVQKMTDIHLHSHITGEFETNGDITSVFIFSAIALFLVLIACVNYMNLATARASIRTKEIGIRKTLGAVRSKLISQFLVESLFLSFVSLVLAVVLAEVFLPTFNFLTSKELTGSSIREPFLLGLMVLLWLVVGIVSGSYPALYLSGFRPIQVLKGTGVTGAPGKRLREGLVVLQFVISAALIICTTVVYNQMKYIRNKNLGLDKEHVLLVSIPDSTVRKEFDLIKTAFHQVPGVGGIAGSQLTPAQALVNSSSFPPASLSRSDQTQGLPQSVLQEWVMRFVAVDDNFFPVLGVPLAAGRYFSKEYQTDGKAFVINELAVRHYGWKSPGEAIGKELITGYGGPNQATGPIVGVVRDFHFESLHEPIKPMVFLYRPPNIGSFIVKIESGNIRSTVGELESVWHGIVPNWPFVNRFLDDDYEALYRSEERTGVLFSSFAVIAIVIACLGLFGLSAFVIEQRTKEIGIRKTLGASVPGIVGLLSKKYLALVLLANIVAWPLAYFSMNRWLEDFAYRVDIGPGTFLVTGSAAIVIALLTVSLQAVRAALANPVEALRYE
jgi:putative ABC transport system permease protein